MSSRYVIWASNGENITPLFEFAFEFDSGHRKLFSCSTQLSMKCNPAHKCLGPSKTGLVTDIQVNVYSGNTLSRLSFKNGRMLKIKQSYLTYSLQICDFFFKKQCFNILSLRQYCYTY